MVSLQTAISIRRHGCIITQHVGQLGTLQKVHTDLAGRFCSLATAAADSVDAVSPPCTSSACPDALLNRLS